MAGRTREMKIETPLGTVSGLASGPKGGPVVAVAHGAGGNMTNPVLEGFAAGLTAKDVGCLRFNFAYTEAGKKAPDREPKLRQVWGAAFERAQELGDQVWVSGKSLGGRIGSMMVADGDLGAAGLILIGYPLHPPGRPERIRDAHLYGIKVPMLFLQGTADPFATWDLFKGVLKRLGNKASLHEVEGGDHSFRVRGMKRDDLGTGAALGEVAAGFILEGVG
ncbi:MAG: alpha/beta hydrolase family protein [Actinomycetota bacterium]